MILLFPTIKPELDPESAKLIPLLELNVKETVPKSIDEPFSRIILSLSKLSGIAPKARSFKAITLPSLIVSPPLQLLF